MQNSRTRIFLIYLGIAILVFAGLAFYARTVPYSAGDVMLTQMIQSISASWFDSLMLAVSWLGFLPQAFVLMGAIVIIIGLLGKRWEALVALQGVLVAWLVAELIKDGIERPR